MRPNEHLSTTLCGVKSDVADIGPFVLIVACKLIQTAPLCSGLQSARCSGLLDNGLTPARGQCPLPVNELITVVCYTWRILHASSFATSRHRLVIVFPKAAVPRSRAYRRRHHDGDAGEIASGSSP
jgi:hypothetical protein